MSGGIPIDSLYEWVELIHFYVLSVWLLVIEYVCSVSMTCHVLIFEANRNQTTSHLFYVSRSAGFKDKGLMFRLLPRWKHKASADVLFNTSILCAHVHLCLIFQAVQTHCLLLNNAKAMRWHLKKKKKKEANKTVSWIWFGEFLAKCAANTETRIAQLKCLGLIFFSP